MVECSIWNIAYLKEAIHDVSGKLSWCPIMENLAKLRRLHFTV